MSHRLFAAVLAAAATAGLRPPLAAQPPAAQAPAPPGYLADYVKRPEPDFAWTLEHNTTTDAGTVYALHLVSQKCRVSTK